MKIIQATLSNLNDIVLLFDGYRIFYKQPSDKEAVKEFLLERFQKKDSVILLALDSEEKPMGFTQLYPLFSSVSLQRTYVLNDLFVHSDFRKLGVGEALLNKAKDFAIENGAKGLVLETATDNPAQKLYERLGWKKDLDVFHYSWEA